MHLSFFPFSQRPFSSAPRTDDYFPATDIDSVLGSVTACITRHAGPTIVVGATGHGKTVLCQMIHRRCGDSTRSIVVNGSRCRDNRGLFQNLLYSMKLPYGEMDEGQLRLTLVDCLTSQATASTSTLLVIDEADLLGTLQLEELQSLASLTGPDGWCVDLVLVGDSRLEELLHAASLQSLNQRIAFRGYLSPWTYDDTLGYIRAALDRVLPEAGTRGTIFEDSALDKVHHLTGGVPRLVNQLCDYALVMAAAAEAQPITAVGVDEAWGDLQQLPARTTYESVAVDAQTKFEAGHYDGEIEFGQLDEEPIPDEEPVMDEGPLTDEALTADGGPRSDEPHPDFDGLLRGGLDACWDVVREGVDELELATNEADALKFADSVGGRWGHHEAVAATPEPSVPDDLPTHVTTPEKTMPIATPPNATPGNPGNVHTSINPFLEEFEDEEIIFSRHSLISESPARMRNHVSTCEGVALSDLMRAIDRLHPLVDSERSDPDCNYREDQTDECGSITTESGALHSLDETDANAVIVEATCFDWVPSESNSESLTEWMPPIGAATISAGTGDAAYHEWAESPVVIDGQPAAPPNLAIEEPWSDAAGQPAVAVDSPDCDSPDTSSDMHEVMGRESKFALGLEPECEPDIESTIDPNTNRGARAPAPGGSPTALVSKTETTDPRHRDTAMVAQQRPIEAHPRDRADIRTRGETDKKRAQRRFGRLFSKLNQQKHEST